ncbi:mechanosensitive ion channel [Cyanobacterium stanieri LEGE 03274]|uniref:Mechanosensitive ion channel n=1 Tax=Cyanobacterium stanieri LEGE 03274 TaxID=1828756 RepID=A0ABR9V5V6_9CHRO|nr:mechanosensitive ion channel domain-containing protein [Cyanobacterium stanieri]MBE9222924.1 mechanosensitive ion channel [Cyanobacterium stanieri LEGE 03274]
MKKYYILGFVFLTYFSPFFYSHLWAVKAQESSVESLEENVFFADVVVRGKPIFQVGGLANITATERARTINRRIASLLSQSNSFNSVEVTVNGDGSSALLRVNNRVLMTVTTQDALDFNVSVSELAGLWAEDLNENLSQPSLVVDVAQRLDVTIQGLVRDTINNLPSLVGALIVIIFTWLVAVGVKNIAFVWAEKTEGDRSTEILISRLCYGGVWIVGSVISLGILGLDFGLLLGTLGLTSVAIGFSLKDVLGNYISGVILLAARPFRINDQVVISDYEGTITQIQLRAITLQTYDGRLVYIPNQQVFQSSIVNITASPFRRSSIVFGVDDSGDLNLVKQIIRETVVNIVGVESERKIMILVKELIPSTVNIEVLFWVNSRRQSFLQVTSDVCQGIKEALEKANIETPTNSYVITVDNPSILDGGLHPTDTVS